MNARPPSLLDEWLHRITEELAAYDRDHLDAPSAPFAVNQIVHKTNDRLEDDVALTGIHVVEPIIALLVFSHCGARSLLRVDKVRDPARLVARSREVELFRPIKKAPVGA